MSEKLFIRVRKDGFIYPYNDIMATNPACEVITEEEAYPERFTDNPNPSSKQRGRKPRVVLDAPPPQELEGNTIAENLGPEASKGLPQ